MEGDIPVAVALCGRAEIRDVSGIGGSRYNAKQADEALTNT